MANLHEGIVVTPRGGRRARVPIPTVMGTNVSSFQAAESEVEVEAMPAVVKASEEYPFKIDVSQQLRLQGAEPPYSINLLRFYERTTSAERQEWSADNPFVSMDEQGVITYEPRGTYVRNQLIIRVGVGAENAPAPQEEVEVGDIYAAPEEERTLDDDPEFDQDDAPMLDGIEVPIQFTEDVIGDPEAEQQFWTNQRMDQTCAAASTGSALASEGVGDYEAVIERTTVMVDEDGNVVGYIGENAPDILWNGEPIYHATIQAYVTPRPGFDDEYIDENGLTYGANEVRMVTIDGEDVYVYSVIDYNPASEDIGYAVLKTVFDGFGVDNHSGHATDFTTLIRELEAGNNIIAVVDADELWSTNGALLEEIHENAELDWDVSYTGFRPDPLNSQESHALWITGIDVSNPEQPIIIVNDSNTAQGEGSARYSLQRFLAAWEDAEFLYVATGDESPDAGHQAETQAIAEIASTQFDVDVVRTTDTIAERLAFVEEHGTFWAIYDYMTPTGLTKLSNTYPNMYQAIAADLDAKSPGFNQRLADWVEDVTTEQQRIIDEYGLDPEDIKRVTANLVDE